tara:strand:- start:1561 stop:1821 length:261 start_codon:yes stop_codon:yes gene_type:complete
MPGGRKKQSLAQRTSLLKPDPNFLKFKKNSRFNENILFDEVAPTLGSIGGGEVVPPSPTPPSSTSNLLTQAGNTLITQAGNNLILN